MSSKASRCTPTCGHATSVPPLPPLLTPSLSPPVQLSFRFTYNPALPPITHSSQFSAAFLTGCVSVLWSAVIISLAIYDLRQKVPVDIDI